MATLVAQPPTTAPQQPVAHLDVSQEVFTGAKAYDQHRLSYRSDAVDALLHKLKVAGRPGAKILEVGCGTGKFTESLALRPERYTVNAVEPHDNMRAQLAAKNLPGVGTLPGTGDHMPAVGDGWADACIIAQAFHWFATPEALAELHRVMKPGAMLGMIWNIEDYGKPASWTATTKWEQKMNDASLALVDDTPQFKDETWRTVFEEQPDRNLKFRRPLESEGVKFTGWMTADAMWARLKTHGQIAVLKGAELDGAKQVLDDALAGDDVEVNEKGEIAVHAQCFYAWTERL